MIMNLSASARAYYPGLVFPIIDYAKNDSKSRSFQLLSRLKEKSQMGYSIAEKDIKQVKMLFWKLLLPTVGNAEITKEK